MTSLDLRLLSTADLSFASSLDALIAFESAQDPAIDAAVAAIIADVRARGDEAVLEYTRRFDRLDAASVQALEVSPADLAAACDALPGAERDALAQAAARVRRYHERQRGGGFSVTDEDGSELGQRITPLDRVGIYVPGGKAAYPSSVLMNALPAQVAGVREIFMAVPTPGGVRNPLVFAAAHIAGMLDLEQAARLVVHDRRSGWKAGRQQQTLLLLHARVSSPHRGQQRRQLPHADG